ncbi:cytochrome c biogenesis protein CcsA [Bacteroides caecigallinarum]|uniref:cytochrome c biogenesis protein CcsA n=1 Tax=Bacteroides caecigallinarum TaxID=1411144 RepID=UPI0019583CC5|nr:cytochrome c biogenesis protein CcsA [Bacteroides caecigallinarum]MBM6882347.1 cytochrome c biogenesis protein CcsA [Bacteroides caecigallinarum]
MTNKLLKISKQTTIITISLLIIIMVSATIAEKTYGTPFVSQHFYSNPIFIALWFVAAISGTVYILERKLNKRTITFCMHASFIIILSGAFITHIFGLQGSIHLRMDENPKQSFRTSDETEHELPFCISLKEFRTEYYSGTSTPMDYVSTISIHDGSDTEGTVSMNRIFKHRGYRFYQSGYDADGKGSTLYVSHDPIGIAVTYTGYLLLFLSMILFFFEKKSAFKKRISAVFILLIIPFASLFAENKLPPTLPAGTAEIFGNIRVNYNGRIAPLQTLAIDFTKKIYGEKSYEDLSAEQVLTGCFFYYDYWKEEPFIRIKSKYVQKVLGVESKYAKLTDFIGTDGFKIDNKLKTEKDRKRIRELEEAAEKISLISSLCTGNLLKIYPVFDNEKGAYTWYSIPDNLPSDIERDKWLFIRYSMNYIAEKVAMKDFDGTEKLTDKIIKFQEKEAGNSLPSNTEFKAERIYNSFANLKLLAMFCLTIGIFGYIFQIYNVVKGKGKSGTNRYMYILLFPTLIYVSVIIALRWIISGHIPVSNGFETMLIMSVVSILFSIIFYRRMNNSVSVGYMISGLALLVAMMGDSNPAITPLMPVLSSPLLSIHVMSIMISYSLFAIMMLNGISAEILHRSGNRSNEVCNLENNSRIILYPAVFLLVFGIFIGAIWANVSWGRYWGWDPKEVWALITMLIYSSALHTESIRFFKSPMFFHRFCILAFISVLITYFGVNFILGGMHSYA